MITHTIILTAPRFEMPTNPNIIELVNDLVQNNSLNVDYFGGQLDNPVDYIDDEMTETINNTAYITIHFDHENEVNYESDKETTINLFVSKMMENEIREVIVDEKDIEIYIY